MSTCPSYNDTTGNVNYTYSTLPILGFDATVVATQIGTDFPFKPIFAGNGIQVDETTNTGAITITYTGAPGQPYTYSTQPVIGADATVVGTQIGTNFGFKPLNGGVGITVDETTLPGAVSISSAVTYSTLPVLDLDATVVDTLVGADFRFKGFIAGPGINIDETTTPGAITVSSFNPASPPIFVNNTVFVDEQYGDDLVGTRERFDLPFQTITAAVAAAIVNDTIHIHPGSYTDSVTLNIPLKFYLEPNANWSTTNTPMMNLAYSGSISVGGYGNFSTSLSTGSIMTVSPGFNIFNSTFKAFGLTVSSGTAFINVTGLDVEVEYISIDANGMLYDKNTTTGITSIKITTNELIVTGAKVASIISGAADISFQINANLFRLISPNITSPIIYNGSRANIVLNANVINATSPINNIPLIDITDTDATSVRSNVILTINTGTFNMNGGSILLLTSLKNAGLRNIYPRVNFNVDTLTAVNVGVFAQPNFIRAIRGDIFIKSNNVLIDSLASSNAVFATVDGTLNILCVNQFSWNFLASANFIDTTFANLDIGNLIWSGLLTSTDGILRGGSINGVGLCGISGKWSVNANSFIMNNITSTLINASTDTISLFCDTIQLNTGSANSAISASGGLIKIKAQELTFSATSNHPVVLIGSVGNSINADIIRDISVSNSGSIALTGKQLICNSSIVNAIITTTRGAFCAFESATISNKNTAFNVSSALGVLDCKFGTLTCATTQNSFTATAGSTLIINANNVVHNITSGLSFVDISASNLTMNLGRISTNAARVLNSVSTSTIFVNIDYASLTNSLAIMASSGASYIGCKQISTTSASLITISGITRLELSGSYTAATNIVVNSGASSMAINGCRLVSTSNCITSTLAGFIVSATPSSARVTVNGLSSVIPVGALFIDAAL